MRNYSNVIEQPLVKYNFHYLESLSLHVEEKFTSIIFSDRAISKDSEGYENKNRAKNKMPTQLLATFCNRINIYDKFDLLYVIAHFALTSRIDAHTC